MQRFGMLASCNDDKNPHQIFSTALPVQNITKLRAPFFKLTVHMLPSPLLFSEKAIESVEKNSEFQPI